MANSAQFRINSMSSGNMHFYHTCMPHKPGGPSTGICLENAFNQAPQGSTAHHVSSQVLFIFSHWERKRRDEAERRHRGVAQAPPSNIAPREVRLILSGIPLSLISYYRMATAYPHVLGEISRGCRYRSSRQIPHYMSPIRYIFSISRHRQTS